MVKIPPIANLQNVSGHAMTTMKQLILSTIFLLTTLLCFGQKAHLEPARDFKEYQGDLKEYYDNVFPILYKGFQTKPYARYTSMPSFSFEYSFSVEQKDNKYLIISNSLSESYWYSKSKRAVKVISKQTEITEELHKKIGELFQLLAEQTKKPESETMGLDGVIYYFSTTDNAGQVTIGETWSPNDNSLLDRLVKICDNLHSIGNGKTVSHTDTLKEIKVLIDDFNKNN